MVTQEDTMYSHLDTTTINQLNSQITTGIDYLHTKTTISYVTKIRSNITQKELDIGTYKITSIQVTTQLYLHLLQISPKPVDQDNYPNHFPKIQIYHHLSPPDTTSLIVNQKTLTNQSNQQKHHLYYEHQSQQLTKKRKKHPSHQEKQHTSRSYNKPPIHPNQRLFN